MAKNKKTKNISDYQRIMFGMVALVALVAMIGMMSYSKNPSDQGYGASGEEQGFLVQEVDLQNNVISEWYEYEDYTTKSLSGVATKVPAYCKDTDGGWDYYEKGTVTQQRKDGRIKIKVDKCKNSDDVIEWACSGTVIRKRTYDCSKEGKECSDGACISTIPQPVCGNGILEAGEYCDGYESRDCTVNGLNGIQECTSQCIWGPCTSTGYCGDGIIGPGEECDGSPMPCIDTHGRAGISQCDNDDCILESYCKNTDVCGDGILSVPAEQCDGSDLAGKTCTNFGNFNSGVLRCINCRYDTNGCIGEIQCVLKGNGMVGFTLYLYGDRTKAVTDFLRNGETKTYTIDGIDYEVTAVYIDDHDPKSAKMMVNGMLAKMMNEHEESVLDGVAIKINTIMTTPGNGVVDLYLVEATTGKTMDITLKDSQTVTVSYNNEFYYEVTAIFINGPTNPSAIISVNGILTKELNPGETDLLSREVGVGVYSVEVCTSTQYCGNGIVDPAEQCDDGNTIQGDGCSDHCLFENPLQCIDTDDGRDYETKGITYGRLPAEGEHYGNQTDKCVNFINGVTEVPEIPITSCTGDDCGLEEYYCDYSSQLDTEYVAFETVKCYHGCSDGACLPPSVIYECVDGDGGKMYYEKGITTFATLSKQDGCDPGGVGVVEYHCFNDVLVKDGFFHTVVRGQKFSVQYLGYDPAQRTVTFQTFVPEGPGEFMVVSILPGDTELELILMGYAHRFYLNDPTDPETSLRPWKVKGVFEEYVICGNGCRDGACVQETGLSLSGYPGFLFSNGVFDGLIVIGARAPSTDAVAGIEIGSSLQAESQYPLAIGYAVIDTDAPAIGSRNMIVIGSPCWNTVAAELMGFPQDCREGLDPGKGMIKLFNHQGKIQVLVSGYEAQETLGTAYVLADYEDYDLATNECEVTVNPGLTEMIVNC